MSRGNLHLKSVFSKERTFRPKKKFEPGTTKFQLHKKAQASLQSGIEYSCSVQTGLRPCTLQGQFGLSAVANGKGLDLKAIVNLPDGEDLNDWIAVHVVDFFNRINLIYGTVADFCTPEACPLMSGGPKYEYRWQDSHKYKKPTVLPAPHYIQLLMAWIEELINDDAVFPTRVGTPFPKCFQSTCKKILTRLHRVFIHVYIHHFDRVQGMCAEAHVNACYKHYFYFVTRYGLVDKKELEPLREMQEGICHGNRRREERF